MNKIYLIFLFFPLFFNAQISFFRTYSNDGFERGEGVCQLADSSYLITGSSSSFSASKQAIIMHVDSLGNFLWSKHYGGAEAEKGRRIFHVPNDGIYVIGQTNSQEGKFHDAYFFKTDEEGELLFEKNYGGSSYEDIFDAVLLKDTSFIAVGETSSSSINETEDVYLLRINRFGDTLWTKSFGSIYADKAKSIKMLNDTTVYIVGEMYDEILSKQRGMLIKMHINGTIEWTKLYGNETKHGFNDLNIYEDTIRLVGYVFNETQNDRSNLYMSSHLLDGTLFNQNIEYNTGTFSIEHIDKYGGNYLLLKSIKDEPSIPTFENGWDANAYLYNGNLLFQSKDFKFSYTGNDVINQMKKTSDNGMVFIGYSSFPSTIESKMIFAKIGKDNVFNSTVINNNLVQIIENKNIKATIYPNPTNDFIYIKSEEKIEEVLLFNNLNQHILKSSENIIDVKNLPAGLYNLKVKLGNEWYYSKISILN